MVNTLTVTSSNFILLHTRNRRLKMSLYPVSIRRCQHIKANGTQCASPAMREEKHCYFHMRWRLKSMEVNMNPNERGTISLPTLEDANSVQVGLAEMLRLLATNQ